MFAAQLTLEIFKLFLINFLKGKQTQDAQKKL